MTGPKDFSSFLSTETKSRTFSDMTASFKYVNDPNIVFLGGGLPMSNYFPWSKITIESPLPPFANGIASSEYDDPSKIQTAVLTKSGVEEYDIPLNRSLQYGSFHGFTELLKILKEHTDLFHSIPYSEWDITLSGGNTQSIEAVMRTFIDRGDTMLAEQYSFPSSIVAMKTIGADIISVPLDAHGIIPEKLEEILENWDSSKPMPKLLYCIPTGQNPTGSNLSYERKQNIYRLACQFNFIIVEDDPYYFLQMDEYSPSLEVERLPKEQFKDALCKSFASMDVEGRVIRLESFSKILAPGTRMGWVVAQKNIMKHICDFNESSFLSISGFSQSMVNSLLQRWGHDGYIDWLIGLRKEYTIKRNSTTNSIMKYFPEGSIIYESPVAGMFFTVKFDASKHPKYSEKFHKLDVENAIYQEAIKAGCVLIPGSLFSTSAEVDHESTEIFFRGTYAAVDLQRLDEGLKRFADAAKIQFQI